LGCCFFFFFLDEVMVGAVEAAATRVDDTSTEGGVEDLEEAAATAGESPLTDRKGGAIGPRISCKSGGMKGGLSGN
jgi:hypothetical protein